MTIPPNSLRWLVGLILLISVVSLLMGKSGLYELYKANKECDALEFAIVEESLKVDSLREVKRRLEEDNKYIERAVRSELGYSKPDEIVIKFIDK